MNTKSEMTAEHLTGIPLFDQVLGRFVSRRTMAEIDAERERAQQKPAQNVALVHNYVGRPEGDVVTFADGAKLMENGYSVAPAHWGAKAPTGPWLTYRAHKQHFARGYEGYGDQALAVVTGSHPIAGTPGSINVGDGMTPEYVRSTHLVAVRICSHDKKLAADLDAIVTATIPAHVTSPVRLDNAPGRGSLRVFALDSGGEPFASLTTCRFKLPRDKTAVEGNWSYTPHYAEMLSGGGDGAFIYSADENLSPYVWTHGGLLAVRRTDLPTLNCEAATRMRDAMEALLAARGEFYC